MKGGPSYTADVLSSLPVMILNGRVGLKSQVFTGLKDGNKEKKFKSYCLPMLSLLAKRLEKQQKKKNKKLQCSLANCLRLGRKAVKTQVYSSLQKII